VMGRHSERMPKLLEPNPDALRRHSTPNREEPNPDAAQRPSEPNPDASQSLSEPNPDAARRPFPVREGLKEIIVGGDG